MKLLRLAIIAASLLVPSLALAQSPVSLCVPAFNANTGAMSCVPVGQTSPNITTINPLPVGGVANAAAPTYVEGRLGGLSFDLSGNVRVTGTFTPSGTSPEFAPVAPGAATATVSVLGGCQATTAAVNPTTGQQAACSTDTNNNLLVSSGGAPNLTTSQVTVTTASTAVCPVRALRRSCSVSTITGTQQVFCSGTVATTANGQIFPAVVGASFPFQTTAAVNCIAVSSSQVVSVVEAF